MKLPTLKRATTFVDVTKTPCFVTRLPLKPLGVGKHVASKSKRDLMTTISIRVADPKAMSEWSKSTLQKLLNEGGLVAAIEQGMSQYQDTNSWPGYEPEATRLIDKRGIVSLLELSDIILDEIQREIILVATTTVDSNLDEHGVVIHGSDQAWHLDYAEYLYDYTSRLIREQSQKVIDQLRSTARQSNTANPGVDFIFGVWEYDVEKSESLMEQAKFNRSDRNLRIGATRGLRYRFTPKLLEVLPGRGDEAINLPVISYEWVDDRVSITHHGRVSGQVRVRSFHYIDGRLIDSEAIWLVLRKIAD